MYRVNSYGISEIAHFLITNHKVFAKRVPTIGELHAWARDIEFSLSEGNDASFEIPAYNSLSGRVAVCTLTPGAYQL